MNLEQLFFEGLEARAGVMGGRTSHPARSHSAVVARPAPRRMTSQVLGALVLSATVACGTVQHAPIQVAKTHAESPLVRFSSVLVRVLALSSLSAGWDGDGSQAPSVKSIAAAKQVVRAFSRASGGKDRGTSPQVAPLASGGYQFEWRNGDRELIVSCLKDGTLDILESSSSYEREYTGSIAALDPALRRFLDA